MIKKLFFVSTLFLLTSFSTSSALTETQLQQTTKKDTSYLLELYENDKWGFMGKKFIDELEGTYNRSKALDNIATLNLFLIILTPIIIGGSLITIHNTHYDYFYWLGDERESLYFKIAIIELILMIAIGITATKLLDKRIDRKVVERNYWVIKNFLNNWKTYRDITPKELYPLFEKLIQNFDDLESGDNTRIINEIKQQVRNNHSVYYEKYKQAITKPPVINNYYR